MQRRLIVITCRNVVNSKKLCYTGYMKVTEITVCNLRNLVRQTVKPGGKLNIITGDNAQGKTNLVESVYLCCLGKSPRADKDKDMICWNKDYAYVKLKYNCRFGDGEIYIALRADAKKQISVNSVPITKMGELMGYLNCIYFSPNEIRIISQSPAERRRFLDIDLCQTDKNYFYSLSRYNKALAQRNNLLKQARSLDEIQDMLFVWNKQLAEEGAKVVLKRAQFCEKLKIHANKCHAALSDGKENLTIDYVTQISGSDYETLYSNYLRMLSDATEKDFQLRHTSIGCQRDDIALKINNMDVRNFGSQGQQRTAALALKLAELNIIKEIIGERPVLILDDVLSELDADRQKRLLNFDDDLQILLTTATEIDPELIQTECKRFGIKSGVCEEL